MSQPKPMPTAWLSQQGMDAIAKRRQEIIDANNKRREQLSQRPVIAPTKGGL